MTNAMNIQDATGNTFEGIWQYARSIPVATPEGAHLTDQYTFICDQDTVIVRLVSISSLRNQPDNGIYRLKAKWIGDTLYYLPPYGNQWAKLARFNGDHFFSEGDGERWEYKKIAPAEIADWNTEMLKAEVPLFSYPP